MDVCRDTLVCGPIGPSEQASERSRGDEGPRRTRTRQFEGLGSSGLHITSSSLIRYYY